MVGSSMGARLVLEIARRGHSGVVIALDPAGSGKDGSGPSSQRPLPHLSSWCALRPALPTIARSIAGRTALMAQLSAKPWNLDPGLVSGELESFANTKTFDSLVKDLANGPPQEGTSERTAPIIIGWGRKDRLCLPRQATRALKAFPGAQLHWFDGSGHFPMWDQPDETVSVILSGTTSGAAENRFDRERLQVPAPRRADGPLKGSLERT